jgi:DNA-binding transcriptional MerR regulator
MPSSTTALSISEVAEQTGLTIATLRYYERAGLMLTPIHRGSSTHREYSEQDVNWIVFLTKLRSTALPIARIRDYAELVKKGDASFADRLELLQRHRITVAARLESMSASLDAIDYKISVYSERLSPA